MKKGPLAVTVVVIGLILIGIVGPELLPGLTRKMPQMFIVSIAAIGLNIILGYAGMFHFGIAAFVAISVYATGILSYQNFPFGIGFWPLLIIAPLITMVVGLALGAPMMRVRGDYFAIVTLGFAEIIKDTLINLETITKGSQGIGPIPVPTIPFIDLSFSGSTRLWYFFTLVALAVCIKLTKNISETKFGRAWRAIRDDELALGCCGINPVAVKMRALGLGCFLVGIAGVLYASNLETTAQPQTYDFNFSAMLIVMVILGGLGSIYGSVLGVAIIQGFDSMTAVLSEYLQSVFSGASDMSVLLDLKNWKWMFFGIALIVLMRVRPNGLISGSK